MPDRPSTVTVGLIQARAAPDPKTNLEATIARIKAAAKKGAQVVSTQELFLTPYFCQHEDASLFALAEPIPGPTTQALQRTAKEAGVVIVASLFERRAPGVFHNTAAVIDADGALLGTYRKMHIPDDPNYYEKFYFTPGDQGFKAFDTKHGRIGVLVCWDQWYPEAARLTALEGADIIFYPTAIGAHAREPEGVPEVQRDAWVTMQRAHAISNGVFVAATNRVGTEEEMRFWGTSFVSSPFGEIIAKGPTDAEETILATCDLEAIDRTREGWPFFRDRRIDAYSGILKRWAK